MHDADEQKAVTAVHKMKKNQYFIKIVEATQTIDRPWPWSKLECYVV